MFPTYFNRYLAVIHLLTRPLSRNIFQTLTTIMTQSSTSISAIPSEPTTRSTFLDFTTSFEHLAQLSPPLQTYIFNTDANGLYVPCLYPISGNYGLLPRILFYCTLIFTLVGRTNQWLIAGALASALTYSGVAAIHACFSIWGAPMWGELDILGLYAILSSSCLIAVPLLNWSSTLRNLHRVSGTSSSRTIIVFWNFLVAVGLLCLLVSIERSFSWDGYRFQGDLENITCTPNGNLDLSAGQSLKWELEILVMDTEFIQKNQCSDPCSVLTSPSPRFRINSDLVGLKMKEFEFLWFYSIVNWSQGSSSIRYLGHITQGIWCISAIVAQGIWCVCFGSRSPLQLRNLLYCFFRALNIGGSKAMGKTAAKYLAVLAQLWAVLVLVSCPVIFVLNIVGIELFISFFPESDPPIHVGAWSAWASTALIICAALISQFHGNLTELKKEVLYQIWNAWDTLSPPRAVHAMRHITDVPDLTRDIRLGNNDRRRLIATAAKFTLYKLSKICHAGLQIIHHASKIPSREWKELQAFWEDPEKVTGYYSKMKERDRGVSALLRHIHGNEYVFNISFLGVITLNARLGEVVSREEMMKRSAGYHCLQIGRDSVGTEVDSFVLPLVHVSSLDLSPSQP